MGNTKKWKRRRSRNRENRDPEAQEIDEDAAVVPQSPWGKRTPLQIALVSAILVELVFFFGFATTMLLYSPQFPWSPWSASGKCSDICDGGVCLRRGFFYADRKGSIGGENVIAFPDDVKNYNEEPDENWAEIPDDLNMLFVSFSPGTFGENAEDDDESGDGSTQITKITDGTTSIDGTTTGTDGTTIVVKTTTSTAETTITTRETTTTKLTTTTEFYSVIEPPVVAIMFIISYTYQHGLYFEYYFHCSAAALSLSWVLLNDDGCITLPLNQSLPKNQFETYVIRTRSTSRVHNPAASQNLRDRIFITKYVTYKKLGVAYFDKTMDMADNWCAHYYPNYVKAEKAYAFFWPPKKNLTINMMNDTLMETVSVDLTGKAKAPSHISAPLFLFENNSYYLVGFVSKGETLLNVHLGEYKDWLSKL